VLINFSLDFDEFIWDLDIPQELERAAVAITNIGHAWEEVGVLFVYQTAFEMLRKAGQTAKSQMFRKNFAAELKNILTSNNRRMQTGNADFWDRYIELIESIRSSATNNSDGIAVFGVSGNHYDHSFDQRAISELIAPDVEVIKTSNMASSQTFISARKTRDFGIPRNVEPLEIWRKFRFENFLKYNSGVAIVDRISVSDAVVKDIDFAGISFVLDQLSKNQDRGMVDVYLRIRGSAKNRNRYFDKIERKIADLRLERLSVYGIEDSDDFKDYPRWRYIRGGRAVYLTEGGLSIFDRPVRPFDFTFVPSYAKLEWEKYEARLRDYARACYAST